MSIELYPSIAKIKRNGVYENLPGFVPETGAVATQQMIATSESSATAQYAHNKGEYFRLNDTLYQAIVRINVGDSIVVGTNCEVAVLGNDVTHIANSIAEYELGIATAAHSTGEYFMVGEVLYVATNDIEVGDNISTSTNCRVAVVCDELSELKTAITQKTGNLWTGDSSFTLIRGTLNSYPAYITPPSTALVLSYKTTGISNVSKMGVQTSLNGTVVENLSSVSISENGRAIVQLSNYNFDKINIYLKSGTTTGATVTISEIQLESGSAATEYVPPITAVDYIIREKVNNELSGETYNIWNGVDETTLLKGTKNNEITPFTPSLDTFSISFKTTNISNLTQLGVQTTLNGVSVDNITVNITENKRTGTALTSGNFDTLKIFIKSAAPTGATVKISDIQLEKGSTIHPYVPNISAIDYVARAKIDEIIEPDLLKLNDVYLPVNMLSEYNAFTCVNKSEIELNSSTKILAFGDSVTHGGSWGESWVDQLCTIIGCTNVNKSHTGALYGEAVRDNTYWISTQIASVTAEEWSAATLVVLAAGSNDAGYNTTDSDLYAKVQSAITSIKANTNAPILVITPIKRGSSDTDSNYLKLPKISGIIEHVALLNKCSVICGLNFPIPSYTNGVISSLMDSYIHPTDDGGYIYAVSVINAIT